MCIVVAAAVALPKFFVSGVDVGYQQQTTDRDYEEEIVDRGCQSW